MEESVSGLRMVACWPLLKLCLVHEDLLFVNFICMFEVYWERIFFNYTYVYLPIEFIFSVTHMYMWRGGSPFGIG